MLTPRSSVLRSRSIFLFLHPGCDFSESKPGPTGRMHSSLRALWCGVTPWGDGVHDTLGKARVHSNISSEDYRKTAADTARQLEFARGEHIHIVICGSDVSQKNTPR